MSKPKFFIPRCHSTEVSIWKAMGNLCVLGWGGGGWGGWDGRGVYKDIKECSLNNGDLCIVGICCCIFLILALCFLFTFIPFVKKNE